MNKKTYILIFFSLQIIAQSAAFAQPLPNTPFCGSEIRINGNQQSLFFSWAPIDAASVTAEYEFTLVELRRRSPQDAINTTSPLYRTITWGTSLTYGITELQPGGAYAWRIRAVDPNGLNQFNNQGYSKVCTFTMSEEEVPLRDAPPGQWLPGRVP